MAVVSSPAPLPVTLLLGPTASGKSDLAFEIARHAGAEIISADSMQVYRGMDIGTAKPSFEQRRQVSHHLIDICDITETYCVAEFVRLADQAARAIGQRGRGILVTGGSALYLKGFIEGIFEGPARSTEVRERLLRESQNLGVQALHQRLNEIDPEAARRIHPNDLRRIVRALEVHELTRTPISAWQQQAGRPRPGYRFRLFGLRRPRAELYRRINDRVDRMLARGLVEETRRLLEVSGGWGRGPLQALGYRETVAYLRGEHDLARATQLIQQGSRQFAKRQITWFRHFQNVEWIDLAEGESMEAVAAGLFPRFFS
ncbi:MAG: tRNA (adenosine(37)-N6)-dimethylallyltransferase MiaA [Planctomycetes bacterium]|nr:tRNA (adenosine(37)-N6)-dimethylallyltransferase MiaA [Planctomycetota bacterium]